MRTYKDKLQNHKRNRHLQTDVRIISQVYNHFVALTLRHYRIYGECEGYKRATYMRMSQHLTKLKKLSKYAHWNIPYSWALQESLKRLDRGYINFFEGRVKRLPQFKGWRKYRSMTFNGNQIKIEVLEKSGGCPVAKIRINGRWYRFWYSREIRGAIKRAGLLGCGVFGVEKSGGCPVAKIRINGRWYRFWYSREIRGAIKRATIKRCVA